MPHSSPSDALRSNPCHEARRVVRPALFLDYGADSVSGDDAACELCSRGMRFRSRWRFEIGTLIRVALTHLPPGDALPERLEVEGMVVESTPEGGNAGNTGEGILLTTLAFVEPPEALKSALGEVSARLLLP